MSNLANPKHELFARGLARGMSSEEAYKAAGFKVDDKIDGKSGNAFKLSKLPAIVSRVNELVNEMEVKVGTSIEALEEMTPDEVRNLITTNIIIKEIVVSIKMSQQSGQFAATKALIELLGKEIGMFGGNGSVDNNDGANVTNNTQVILNVLQNIDQLSDMSKQLVDVTPRSKFAHDKVDESNMITVSK